MSDDYENPGPSRDEIDASVGRVALEFGTGWCGYCRSAAPHISKALAAFPDALWLVAYHL